MQKRRVQAGFRVARSAALLSALLGAVVGLFVACDVDSPCDPGQEPMQGACVPRAVATDSGNAAGDAAADEDAGCTEALETKLGETCTSDGDCNCASPFCAIMPGAPEGYCSIRDCSLTPDDCPMGYECYDLSVILPSLPRYCQKQ